MALSLTTEAKNKASEIQKTPNLIVEIDGLEKNLSFVPNEKTLRFDDGYNFDDLGLFFDTAVLDNKNDPFIMAKDGKTTRQLSQQLQQDKGATSSVQSLTISVTDENNEISTQLANIQVLGVRARAYLTFKGLEHPQNSSKIFDGSIDKFDVSGGRVDLIIRNPESLKRQQVFQLYQSNLTANISSGATAIPVVSTEGFLESQGPMTSHIRIDNEIIQVGGVSGNSFINCVRGSLNTSLAPHDIDAEVSSNYRLQGDAINLALNIMLSGAGYLASETVFAFIQTGGVINPTAIFFDDPNIEQSTGLSTGDEVQITGSASNDGVYTITGFGLVTSTGQSYITVNTALNSEVVSTETIQASFKSSYDTLPDGCKMAVNEVDIEQHIFIQDQFLVTAPDIDILLTDTMDVKQFIEKELYFPVGAYTLSRKGRASVGYTAPAVIQANSPTLNSSNIKNATKIQVLRSTNKNFYNSVVYKYEKNTIADKFLANRIRVSGTSFNQIRAGNKPLVIESNGLRQGQAEAFIDTTSRRLLDRYELGARSLTVQANWEVVYPLEVGDTVLFDGRDLEIYDEKSGERTTFERVMEITNISKNITQGNGTIQLTDTNFSVDGRYGTFAPSSIINKGSNSTKIVLKRSFGTEPTEFETDKWVDYIGSKFNIVDASFNVVDSGTIEAIDTVLANTLIVSGLSGSPSENDVVEFPEYDEQTSTQKLLHCSFCPSEPVVSGISQTEFTVGDPSIFFVGAIIEIVNSDFSQQSGELTVTGILGNNITVGSDIGFIPNSNNRVEGIGFASDEGDRYLIF